MDKPKKPAVKTVPAYVFSCPECGDVLQEPEYGADIWTGESLSDWDYEGCPSCGQPLAAPSQVRTARSRR